MTKLYYVITACFFVFLVQCHDLVNINQIEITRQSKNYKSINGSVSSLGRRELLLLCVYICVYDEIMILGLMMVVLRKTMIKKNGEKYRTLF